jgi:hypothetical protein
MALLLNGCEGIHLANLLALGVTVSLFFGTLQLGRRPAAPGDAAARHASSNARAVSTLPPRPAIE